MNATTADAPTSWLVLAVGEFRQHGGNDGYDDEPSEHYSWDDTVPNHAAITVGDRIVLWDKKVLLGASVVDAIESGAASKTLHRCPNCGHGHIKARKTKLPEYRCFRCRREFDEPHHEERSVRTYRSDHARSWVDLAGTLGGTI